VRPHSAIGNQVPAALHRSAGNPGRPMKPGFYGRAWSKVGGKVNGIKHRLTKPDHPWTNGQVERLNCTF